MQGREMGMLSMGKTAVLNGKVILHQISKTDEAMTHRVSYVGKNFRHIQNVLKP